MPLLCAGPKPEATILHEKMTDGKGEANGPSCGSDMPLKSYLLSNLSNLYGAADLRTFLAAQPESWLVWEPGNWRPPTATTSSPLPVEPKTAGGEALAFVLTGSVARPRLTLGRSDADIVINDGTLSRSHLILTCTGAGSWMAEDSGSLNGSTVKGQRLLPQKSVALTSGARVTAGHVMLTYYSAPDMFARIKQHASRLSETTRGA